MITSDLTIEEMFEEFLSMLLTERSASKYTVAAYRSDFNQFVKILRMKRITTNPRELTTADIRKYTAYQKEVKKYAIGSLRRKIQSLKSFFTFMLQNDYIDKNPMYSIQTPERSKTLPAILTLEDVERLKEVLRTYRGADAQRDAMFIKLILYTGVRREEAILLNYSDIDFQRNEIKVMGKGRKQRIIPFKEEFGKDLLFYCQGLTYTKEQVKKKRDALFLNSVGNRIDAPRAQKIKDAIFTAAGFDGKGYHLHSLRHTWATAGLNAGMSLDTVQDILGHGSFNTTRGYARTSKERLKEDVEKLPY